MPRRLSLSPSKQASLEAEAGALRKGPPFHVLRSSMEMKMQHDNCDMGGCEVTRRQTTSLQDKLIDKRAAMWSLH